MFFFLIQTKWTLFLNLIIVTQTLKLSLKKVKLEVRKQHKEVWTYIQLSKGLNWSFLFYNMCYCFKINGSETISKKLVTKIIPLLRVGWRERANVFLSRTLLSCFQMLAGITLTELICNKLLVFLLKGRRRRNAVVKTDVLWHTNTCSLSPHLSHKRTHTHTHTHSAYWIAVIRFSIITR